MAKVKKLKAKEAEASSPTAARQPKATRSNRERAKSKKAVPKEKQGPATAEQRQQQRAPELLRRILAQTSSVSQLEQLCSALGWGRYYAYERRAGWVAEVTCGLGDRLRAESGHHHPRTKKGEKAGRAAAAAKAVEALRGRAAEALSEEPVPLGEAFREGLRAEVVASDSEGWRRLNASLAASAATAGAAVARRAAVGVGTEGNDGSGPPILVQIATRDLVLVELPRARPGGKISSELKELLADENVTKVFCDSAANRDALSLGLSPDGPGVVNLERLAAERFGRPAAARGICRIAGLVLGRRVAKGDDAADWTELESRGQVRSLADVSEQTLRYAALEAYSTLRTWEALQAAWEEHKLKSPTAEATTALDRDVRADEEDAELRALDDEIAALQGQLRSLGDDAGNAGGGKKKVKNGRAEEGKGLRPKAEAAKERKAAKQKRPAENGEERPGKGTRRPAGAAAAGGAAGGATAAAWPGWGRALDAELRGAGGEMPWKRLQERLVARRRSCAAKDLPGSGSGEEEVASWRLEALASIPEGYLSRRDGLVRLPG